MPNLHVLHHVLRLLELRSLPSTGITRPHWYYEPLRHPGAPGLSLAGVRWSSLTAPRASRVSFAFLVCMLSPLPRRSDWRIASLTSPSRVSLPERSSVGLRIVLFEAAQRSLALRPGRSRCHRIS